MTTNVSGLYLWEVKSDNVPNEQLLVTTDSKCIECAIKKAKQYVASRNEIPVEDVDISHVSNRGTLDV